MYRFWTRFIGPLVETVKPRLILEVGADFGWNTRHLLAYCRASGCRLDIVDPAPRAELAEVLAPYGPEHTHHALKSVEAIPRLATPDLALIDGDHNWHTVRSELELLWARAAETGAPPPVTLFHDVAWPYARRDMYYDPQTLSPEHVRPYAYLGLRPGEPGLVEGGMNGMLANALEEGGPRNGVLTAIEDFLAETPGDRSFHVLPFFNGLGILIPAARRTPELERLVAGFTEAPSLLETARELETQHMQARAEMAALREALTRRTDALKRARTLLEERAARLAELDARASR